MNRAERRRAGVQKKERTYTITESQLNDKLVKAREEGYEQAIDTAFLMMLGFPLNVLLGDDYWPKTAKKRLPKFVDDILSLYASYEADALELEDMRREVLELGGVDLKELKLRKH